MPPSCLLTGRMCLGAPPVAGSSIVSTYIPGLASARAAGAYEGIMQHCAAAPCQSSGSKLRQTLAAWISDRQMLRMRDAAEAAAVQSSRSARGRRRAWSVADYRMRFPAL
jgi:hypothetical protein